jgi:dipeptidyl aminopeptidase/acylaminoacyl peptidase
LFFKGLTFYPEKDKIDTSKLKTKLKLILYSPYKKESTLIKDFELIEDWPKKWETHLDYNKNLIGFSLNNTKNKKSSDPEGIYLYNRKNGKIDKIENNGSNFWISPDGKLVIYHLYDEKTDSYKLYGYDVETKKHNLFEEAQPKIKNVEWLKKGEAALLQTEEKDSTILIDFRKK